MSNIYRLFKNRLIEISGKSRSLYSKNISKRQAYNVGKLLESAEEAKKFIEFLWNDNKRRFRLFTPTQARDFCIAASIELDKQQKAVESEINRLKALQREIDSIERETGRYELFLGYPFVEGGIGGGTLVKAPLLLFPAKIMPDAGVEIEILRDEPVLLNKVFLLAYAKENNLSVDDIVMDYDSAAAFSDTAAIRDYLKTFDIKLKYPKQKPVCDVEKAKELSARDDLEIRNFAVLGRFPLANSIYNDYTLMEKNRLTSPALDALLKNRYVKLHNVNLRGIGQRGSRAKDKGEGFFPVSRLDFAQETAIEHINKFGNVVIYGPPGTGKSQTITNIISDALCKNKKVLVVSQKRTAIDVVFNRLGSLNSKVMILPDPEKSKNEFYEKVRLRYSQAESYKSVFSYSRLETVEKNLASELKELQVISEALFTPAKFGLTLQEMYAQSVRIGTSSLDYKIYQKMQQSSIMELNYAQLSEAIKAIAQKNKANLFYNHYLLAKNNPLIDYIKTDLDLDQINRVKTYIAKLLGEETLPFDIAAYSHSRYMLVYSLENHSHSTGLKPLADMITKLENPGLTKKTRACTFFPLFWPAYPFFKAAHIRRRRQITKRLLVAQSAVRRYISEFDLLKTVLEPNGLSMVIDNITYGNARFLKKLSDALDDYMLLRNFNLSLKTLTQTEKMLLQFAFDNTDNKKDFLAAVDSLLPVRIYHEVVREEKNKEAALAKTLVYNDLRKRITALKSEKLALDRDFAMDKFNDDFKQRLELRLEEGKNFLHQINKQNKQWPIRRLMQEFPEFLFDLFPVWMLSPEAVSLVLPLKRDLFDVVLFDEASQIFIENTIPAIYRSKCVVVSGDSKQLRPTSVFIKRYMGDDTYAEMSLSDQAAAEVESLLDLASSRLKPAHLTYHYRSRYEELINFSNYAFYEGRLQIAPNTSRYKNYRPIERIKVDGRWTDRRNLAEAKTVVNLVGKILAGRKNGETLGIVTFNLEQQECIEEMLDQKCERDATFKSAYLKELNRRSDGEYSGVFVKNLENVQGDERDIIIFSVGYAKNEENKLNAQFGTLSMAGGENRLNVAITRAKEKIYVVTSVEPEEFTAIETSKNPGPRLFKKYLQYARAVSEGNRQEISTILGSLLILKPPAAGTPESWDTAGSYDGSSGSFPSMEVQLKAELEKLGYIVDINLGNADYKLSLAIYNPSLDKYVLGIECDYAAKNSSDSVIERDVYRNNFLESRGWKIMRIWSRDFWLNRLALLKAIEKEIETQKALIAQQKEGGGDTRSAAAANGGLQSTVLTSQAKRQNAAHTVAAAKTPQIPAPKTGNGSKAQTVKDSAALTATKTAQPAKSKNPSLPALKTNGKSGNQTQKQ